MRHLYVLLVIIVAALAVALAAALFMALLPLLKMIADIAMGLLALSAVYVVALGAIDLRRRWHHSDVIHLTEHGAYKGTMALHPASVNAARYSIVEASTQASVQTTPALELPAPALPGPYDFATELASWRPSSDSIFLGRTASGIITVPMGKLWHIALTGPTGGGKTNILRLVLAQLLRLKATCYLCDIHYAPIKRGVDWRPIASRLAHPPIRSIDEIADLVEHLARGELQARIDREYRGEPVGDPVYLAIEELPAVMAEKPEIAAHLAKLLRQGRQYDLCFIGATQDMLVKTLGTSSGVRECFRTGYYTGGDMTTARVILDLQKGQSIDEDGLGVEGRVYLKTAISQAQEVRVPFASNDAVYALLGQGDAYRRTEQLGGTKGDTYRQPVEPMEVATTATLTQAQMAKMTMILEMDSRQASQNEIIQAVWNVNPKDRAGQEAARELRLIRAYLAEQALAQREA